MRNSMGLLGWSRTRMVKKLSIILFVVYALSFSQAFAEQEKQCAPPYKPDNIFTVIFNYSEGMDYISSAEKACSDNFAQELIETFRDSFWVSKGCLVVTIEDVEKAKSKRNPPQPA